MKEAPDRVKRLCGDYRGMFTSDAAMAQALCITPAEARVLVSGWRYPTIDEMVEIQSALRKAVFKAEGNHGDLAAIGREPTSIAGNA